MDERPNLLLVFADQLGLNHCGYGGSADARTPHIDAFVTQGISFSNTVSSTPVCAAYRASLFTGKYTTSTGMVINELRMNPRQTCLGHVVTHAGYDTCYIGKWHLYANELGNHTDPKNSFIPPGRHRLGFDGYWAAYNFHHSYYDAYYHRDTAGKIPYGEGVYEPDAQTDMMISYLRGRADAQTPFCAVLSYGTPHDPWTDGNVPPRFRELFEDVEFPDPVNYSDENDPYADAWGRLSPAERGQLSIWRRNYYAMTANLDWNFGRLLGALDEQGLTEDIIIVFSSDHGEMFGAHGRRAKNTFYEEAIRIPCLIRWPGHVPAGAASDACVSTVDIMPTLLGLIDLPIPAEVEGMDCSLLARGERGPEPGAAFLQNTGACAAWEDGFEWRALRDKRYTYAVYRRDGSELLFDNVADPTQLRNLASDAQHAETLKVLRDGISAKMESLNDTFESCTWYQDNWTSDREILRSATMKGTD